MNPHFKLKFQITIPNGQFCITCELGDFPYMQVNRKMTLSEKVQFQISHYQTCFSNISTGLSGVGHEEASFREYVCEAYRLLQCTWLHPLQKLKCDGNILFTAEIKVTADGQKKCRSREKATDPSGRKIKEAWFFFFVFRFLVREFFTNWFLWCKLQKHTHIFIQRTCQLM